MKKLRIHKRLTALTASLVLLFSCVGFSASAEQSNLTPDEQYIAMMDAIDWGEYENHIINVQRAQIPDYLLNQMTTEQLVNAVLHYPYLIDMMCFDKYSDGFQTVATNFNGLAELISREDGAQELLERMQETSVQTQARAVNRDALIQEMYLDTLLAQPEFLNQFSEKEITMAADFINNKVEARLQQPQIYSTGDAYHFYGVVNEQIETYSTWTTVKTPAGSDVRVIAWTSDDVDMSAELKLAYRDEILKSYPTASIMGSATNKYNCHSYAWYKQSTSNTYNMPDPYHYMNDGSYYKISALQLNARIYYKNGPDGHIQGFVILNLAYIQNGDLSVLYYING